MLVNWPAEKASELMLCPYFGVLCNADFILLSCNLIFIIFKVVSLGMKYEFAQTELLREVCPLRYNRSGQNTRSNV